MADWVNISDTALDPDAPLTSELAYAWRDNLIAIAEGAPGAPRIVGAAMFSTSAGTIVQRNCLPWGTESSGTVTVGTITNRVAASAMTALIDCVVQVMLTHIISVSGGSASVSILKNGVVVKNYTTSQTNVTTDVTLAAGDSLAVITIVNGGGSGTTASVSLSVCSYRVDTRSVVMT